MHASMPGLEQVRREAVAGRVRVKLCGMTRGEDARMAAALGADAVGLIFHPPSPRAVGAEQAAAVLEGLAPFVARVGVFVNPRPEALRAVLERVAQAPGVVDERTSLVFEHRRRHVLEAAG